MTEDTRPLCHWHRHTQHTVLFYSPSWPTISRIFLSQLYLKIFSIKCLFIWFMKLKFLTLVKKKIEFYKSDSLGSVSSGSWIIDLIYSVNFICMTSNRLLNIYLFLYETPWLVILIPVRKPRERYLSFVHVECT